MHPYLKTLASFIPVVLLLSLSLSPLQAQEAGFTSLFDGRTLSGWIGNKSSYLVKDGMIVIEPQGGGGGNLYTEKEYGNFVLRFEFQLTPGANNGLGIHAPLEGDAAMWARNSKSWITKQRNMQP
jgi:hypothetical protein